MWRLGLTAPSKIWLLLSYKVPREPTANRVSVWRKLKKLGAVSLQDSVWVLPATSHTREQFRWLATEIDELGGESTLWESSLIGGDEERLIEAFQAPVEAAYREILACLKKRKPDLAALSRRYQHVLAHDYFRCELAQQVRKSLLAAKGDEQ
jgi:Protein ChrB, N-terminal